MTLREMMKINNEFFRKDDEGFDEYAIRLYRNKDIYGVTLVEVGDMLNKQSGNDYDESAYRKKYTPYINGFEDGYEEGYEEGLQMEDDEKSLFIKELRDEREKHYKSRRKLQDKLREYRGYLTTEARAENLREVLTDSIQELNEEYPILKSGAYTPTQDGRVGVLQLSDWHYGEVVEDGLNTYNMDVCQERVEILTEKTIHYIKTMDIQELIVLNLGDLIAGNIRVSARVMNETDVISQSMGVAELLVQCLDTIQRETCIKVEFHSVLDNHSRVSANYNQHVEAESFARLIPWYIEGRVADNKNIKIVENKINEVDEYDIGHFQIYDSDFLFVHGHNDRINSAITDISMLSKKTPVSIFMGHLHHNMEKEEFEIDLIVNPSLVGLGDYSKSIRRISKPRQKLNIYNKADNGGAYREMLIFIEVD